MRTNQLSVFLLLLLVFYSCNKEEQAVNLTPKHIELSARASEIIASNSSFGIELFARVASEENSNLMLSPLSASTALTMLLNGCGGETYSQLKGTLDLPSDITLEQINEAYKGLVTQLLQADAKVKMSLANAIFYRNGFSIKPPFLQTMSNEFSAHIESLNFSELSALTSINAWASSKTNGKIPTVLSEISGNAVMFIMNALYFKGDWSSKFDKSFTAPRPFYLNNGSVVNPATMQGEVMGKIYSHASFSAIEMPYGRTNFTMIVIVPNNTVQELIGEFNPSKWDQLSHGLDLLPEFGKVMVTMPKFTFSFEKFITAQLQSMGTINAFSPYLADLSGISDASIFVSFVKQNTFIEVNEEGTEAAAVTTIGIEITSVNPSSFTVNKPFVFVIRERTTNTMLFIGKVENPTL